MRRVDLNQIEPSIDGASRRSTKISDDLIQSGTIERRWHSVGFIEADCGWSNRLPATLRRRNQPCRLPRNGHARFAARMSQLRSNVGAMLVEKAGDAAQPGDMVIPVDAEIGRRDASLRAYGVCLRNHKRGSANGAAAEVNKVPVVGETIRTGVLAHRRDHDTVRQGQTAKLERREEMRR